MIQIYADGVLTYDSRLDEYDLHGLKVTTGLNKGGTAEIVMPADHPAYSAYIGHRTIVEIYRDGDLRFRGRALYPEDDFYNTRTVICEGELCFLRDGISRPYTYADTLQNVFTAVVGKYNAQVEPFKQFKIGNVEGEGTDTYISMESEDAETVLDTINNMIELCGGYITFTTDATGARVINWVGAMGSTEQQGAEPGVDHYEAGTEGLEYTKSTDGTHYICSDLGMANDKNIIIAATHEGLPVTKIGASAFISNYKLESVTIPDSVNRIGACAFMNCVSLKSVAIPNSVPELDGTFSGCTSLESVVIGTGVTLIRMGTFYNCKNLKHVYYRGTEEQWRVVSKQATQNEPLETATIHYNYTG